jgi:1-acyl-sn-glycerol-3-phosphate acyltransferase
MGIKLLVLLFRFLGFLLKLLYGFRIEGVENLPRTGPYIILYNEPSLLSNICNLVVNFTVISQPFSQGKVLSFVGEEFWALPYARFILTKMRAFPLAPHGSGKYSLRLLDALEHLKQGGVVIIEPEGDTSRDGRPLPIRSGAAWLGLHSAAPFVPVIVSVGAYDIWPSWQALPSLRGQIVQRVGKPFRLTGTPRQRITDENLAVANNRLRCESDRLSYEPDGVTAWAGPPRLNGVPLEQPVQLRPVSIPVAAGQAASESSVPLWRRGIPLLLWRCPVCHTNDALVHERPWFRSQTLHCQACSTYWTIRRVPGKDFRLRVVDGPAEMVGLDMALSTWYDEMKRDFKPLTIQVTGMDLLPDEEVYLQASKCMMLVSRSSALFRDWTGREPPRTEFPKRPGDWAVIEPGTLLLTNRRLLWEGPPGGLDFWWSRVTAASLGLYYLLIINYGITPFRFFLRNENALKWLTYAGTVLQPVAAQNGRKVTVFPF